MLLESMKIHSFFIAANLCGALAMSLGSSTPAYLIFTIPYSKQAVSDLARRIAIKLLISLGGLQHIIQQTLRWL